MPEKTIPEVLGHSVSFPTGAQTETWPEEGWAWPPATKRKLLPMPELKKWGELCVVRGEKDKKLSSNICRELSRARMILILMCIKK